VAALALGSARGDLVEFTYGFEGSYGDNNTALISFNDILDRKFEWKASGIIVEEIALWSQRRGVEIGQAELARDGVKTERRQEHEIGEGPEVRYLTCEFSLSLMIGFSVLTHCAVESYDTGGRVYLTAESYFPPEPLYFKARWNDGYSYSRLFGVAGNEDVALYQELQRNVPFHTEEGRPASKYQSPTAVATTAGATTATDTAGEESTNASGENMDGGLNTPQESAEPASVGLASGAIIGIAVGCGVAGLLLILGLVWYLLRRRRQKKAMHPVDSTYGTGNRGEELMAEKEASADVDVTPHSPYSDDGAPGGSGTGPNSGAAYPDSTAAGHGDGAAAAAAVAAGAMAAPNLSHLQDPPRSFTPYSDRPSVGGTAATAAGTPSLRAPSLAQTDEARVSVPSPIPGRATPRGLTTPYAHLVEEGMTEDEIRRLEDEERQLDAAIEQAGRR
jgi:hypothetical protein